MLPAYSVWCDPTAVTDPALLEGLGRTNPNTAVGVMCNPHLTGARLARVAENANVLVKLLDECAGGSPIMVGRSTEDQVTILEAAAERSTAGARQLSRYLNPEAALILHTRWPDHRLLSHRQVAATIEDRKAVHWLEHHDHPAFPEAVRALAPNQADELLVIADAYNATTSGQLQSLAPRLANLGLQGLAVRHLPLVLYPYPEVSEHWARHGGVVGAAVAATDHRLGTEVLLEMFSTYPEVDQVVGALMANPSVPEKMKVDWISETFARRVAGSLDDGYMHSHDLTRHVGELSALRKSLAGVDVRDLGSTLTLEAARTLLSLHRLNLSSLMRADLAVAAKAWGDHSRPARATTWELVSNLLSSTPEQIPPSMATLVADLMDHRVPCELDEDYFDECDASSLSDLLVRRLTRGRTCPVELAPVVEDDADAQWSAFERGLSFTGPAGTGRHAAATAVRGLTEVGEFVELFALAEAAKQQRSDLAAHLTPHGDPIDFDEPYRARIERVRGRAVPGPSRSAMSDLVPDALGAL